jgi:hypothetical protein
MANGIFSNLLNRLNRVFSRDPKSVPAFQLKASGNSNLVISNRVLTITTVGETIPVVTINFNNPYDAAKSITIADLCNQLNNTSGISVQNISTPFSGLGAIALLEGTFALSEDDWYNVQIFTSTLWAIFRPLAYILETAKNDVDLAIQQLGFATAQNGFLDYWGTIFDIPRLSIPMYATSDPQHNNIIGYTVEPDYEYSNRLLWETVKPRINNLAIENILSRGIGYETTILEYSPNILLGDGMPSLINVTPSNEYTDDLMVGDGFLNNPTMGSPTDTAKYGLGGQYSFTNFGVFVDVPINTSYFQYTTQHLEEIVARHRAAGTTPYFTVTQVANEVLLMVNDTLASIEGIIDQEISASVKFFSQPDEQFYGDHWAASNVAPTPWYQNNLNIPSVGDGVVVETRQVIAPPTFTTEVDTVVLDGSLGDGLSGGFNTNLLVGDSSGTGDNVKFINILTSTTNPAPPPTYENDPVFLSYQRVSDDYLNPRVGETLSDDVMEKTLSSITGPVSSWAGTGSKIDVLSSTSVIITTPISVTAPTSMQGLSVNTLALMLQNIHNVPVVIRNIDAPYLGENWGTDYSDTRSIVIAYQDAAGNIYYQTINVPASPPPPATVLRILNPTAYIWSLDPTDPLSTTDYPDARPKVQVVLGGMVNICWEVTNSDAVGIYRYNNDTGVILEDDTTVGYSGSISYYPTVNTRYVIEATGNNGQIASASIVVSVVLVPITTDAPTITAIATPSVVELCESDQTQISYLVDFNDHVSEEQTVLWEYGSSSLNLTPLSSDPVGTAFANEVPIVSRVDDDTPVYGSWEGYGTSVLTFVPTLEFQNGVLDGISLFFEYAVKYGNHQLFFNNNAIAINPDIETYSQTMTVILPKPGSPTISSYDSYMVGSTEIVQYIVNYAITAVNAAGTRTIILPVYVQPVQQGAGNFAVNNISPTNIPEAVGPTISETVPVTLTGTGFSSKMEVWLRTPTRQAAESVSPGNPTLTQLVQAAVTNIDWVNGSITFIAPQFTFGSYPVRLVKLDCVEDVIAMNETFVLVYDESTYRFPPFVANCQPNYVCSGTGFTPTTIVLNGSNFRSGIVVYMVMNTGLVAKTTTFINENTISFLMDVDVAGIYNLVLINTDTSQGIATQMFQVQDSSIIPIVTQFGYTFPTIDGTTALYGQSFNLHWSCQNTSDVSFMSSDADVEAALSGIWGSEGSVSVVIPAEGVTITMYAHNICGNTLPDTITFTQAQSYHTERIAISPDPVYMNLKQPYKLSVLQTLVDDSTGDQIFVDITTDSDLTFSFVDFRGNPVTTGLATLAGFVLNPVQNGVVSVLASWKGYTDIAVVSIQLPYPVELQVNPMVIDYSQLGLQQQITVMAIYSDGSSLDVTSVCSYSNYSSSITVNDGLVTYITLGITTIRVSFFDNVYTQGILSTIIQVNGTDPCLSVYDIGVTPPFAFLPLSSTSVLSKIYLFGSVLTYYWGDSPHSGSVSAYIWQNVSDLYANGITRVLSDADGMTVGNSLLFDENPYGSISSPVQWTILNSSGIQIGTKNLFDPSLTGGGGYSNFNCCILAYLYVPAAGTYDIGAFYKDSIIWGIGGNCTWAGRGSITGTSGQTKTVIGGYPLLPAAQSGGEGGQQGNSQVPVTFNAAGIYPLEGDWDYWYHYGRTFQITSNGGTIAPIDSIPLNLSQTTKAVLTIDVNNVRTASIDGVSVLNEDLQLNWDYTTPETLSASHVYNIVVANHGTQLTLKASGNLLSVDAPVINKFTAYDADISMSAESSTSITVGYADGIGLCWNTSNAFSVSITDLSTMISTSVADAGTMLVMPTCSTSYRLYVVGYGGAVVISDITVNVSTAVSNEITILCKPAIVQLGQSSNVAYNAYSVEQVTLYAFSDSVVSVNGARPTQNQTTLLSNANNAQYTAFPTTNTMYRFNGKNNYSSFVAAGFVNVDAGAKFISTSISSASVNVGDPVTVSWQTTGAVNVTGDFVGGQNLPLGLASFVIYPDRTQDFKITATSSTGLTTTATIHISVNPQVLSPTCGGLDIPNVTSIYLDGNGNTPSTTEMDAIHVLEIYGSGFVGGRALTSTIVGAVRVVLSNQNGEVPLIDVVGIDTVTDTYIRCKIHVYEYTLADRYFVIVQNDIGVSFQQTALTSFTVDTYVPSFLDTIAVAGHSGDQYTLEIDSYNPIRDAGFSILVGGVEANILSISGFDGIGYPVLVVLSSATVTGIIIMTQNGFGALQKTFVPTPSPASPPTPPAAMSISYVSPALVDTLSTSSVFGNNFASTSTVYVGATACTTTYVSTTKLNFVVPSVTAGGYVVTVVDSVGTYGSVSWMGLTVFIPASTTPTQVPSSQTIGSLNGPLNISPNNNVISTVIPDQIVGAVILQPTVYVPQNPNTAIQTTSINGVDVSPVNADPINVGVFDVAAQSGGWE